MNHLRRSAVAVVAVAVAVFLWWLLVEGLDSAEVAGPTEVAGSVPLWIWDHGAPRHPSRPHAFVAEESVELDEEPERARALVIADEEYLLDINGVWVGGGRYESEAWWDGYDVAALLHRGRNGISVEVRSSRGLGALLFCLEIDGRCVVRSTDEWRVLARSNATASETASGPSGVRVWGEPGIGRWPVPGSIRERRRYDLCLADGPPIRARRIFRAPWREPLSGAAPTWWANWGRVVTGALIVELPTSGPVPVAARFGLGRTMPEPPPPRVPIIGASEVRRYRFAEPLRLYFAEFIGGETPAAAAVRPLRPGCEELVAAPDPATDSTVGIFGLAPVRSATSM